MIRREEDLEDEIKHELDKPKYDENFVFAINHLFKSGNITTKEVFNQVIEDMTEENEICTCGSNIGQREEIKKRIAENMHLD